jgi:hypothetical protein
VTALSQNFIAPGFFEDVDHLIMSSLNGFQKHKFLGFSSFMTYLGY